MATRSSDNYPVFGYPKEFNGRNLPTYHDIMSYYLLVRDNVKKNSDKKSVSAQTVCEKLIDVWNYASITVMSKHKICEKITRYYDSYRNLMKPYKDRSHTDNYQKKLKDFETNAQVLFDIAACRCTSASVCKCKPELKVPPEETDFLLDQRTSRKMVIGGVDLRVTNQRKKRKLKVDQYERYKNRKVVESEDTFATVNTLENVAGSCDNNDASEKASEESGDKVFAATTETFDTRVISDSCGADSDILPDVPNDENAPSTSKGLFWRVSLPSVACELDRRNISDRSGAAIVSAFLTDMGLVSAHDTSSVIDRSKIRRERSKLRNELQEENSVEVKALFFDGRKDKTKTITKDEGTGKYYPTFEKEEHYTLVAEPKSEYVGHVAVHKSDSNTVANSIITFLQKSNIHKSRILAIGCDGTALNTGYKKGIIRQIEEAAGKPMQWLVCLFHANELPLRHLLIAIDGVTHGPRAFSGPIGKALENCHELHVINYQPIYSNLPKISDPKDLSTDQQLLYELAVAVSTGKCSKDLERRTPGLMHHARWLTTACRLLRLYMAQTEPSDGLITLATYVMKVYVPMWFYIKAYNSCFHGSMHLWQLIHRSRYLPQRLLDVVDPVIQRNAYYAHPENLLLRMLIDDRKHIRMLAAKRVEVARATRSAQPIRVFKVPKVDFHCEDCIDLIDWTDSITTAPPLLRNLSNQTLKSLAENPVDCETELVAIPCHSQAVERLVKLVSEASFSISDANQRDGMVKATLRSRSAMSAFNTKSEFVGLVQ